MALLELSAIVIGIFTLTYAYARYVYSYWDRNGIYTYPGFNYLIGHFGPMLKQTKSIFELVNDIYAKSSGPFVGIYGFFKPIFMPRDPELVRNILISDFSSFSDRGVYCDEKRDPLSGHLFSLAGDKWKSLRAKLTPTFTSGKLKMMFSTLVSCGSTVEGYLEKAVKNKEQVDIRELSASMATNVITSVAFGIDVDSINNPNTDFRKYGRKIFSPSLVQALRGLLFFAAPKLMKYMPFKSTDKDVEDFIFAVVKKNLDYREKNNIVRKDFFQLMVQLHNKGTVTLDDQWNSEIKTDEKKLSLEEIAAQVFVFFVAGYETSSSTMSYCMYELAKNPEIQKRVHEDIDRVLKKYNGEITYESISEMEYLECCIDETLRKYPVVAFLLRQCMKDYPIPGTNIIIQKGVDINIPILGLQRDERYYPEPDEFIPERFNAENSVGKNLLTRPYYPFGDGPRNCIGMRLGKMQTKVGLLLMLKQFSFGLDPDEIKKGLEFHPSVNVLAPKETIYYKVKKRST